MGALSAVLRPWREKFPGVTVVPDVRRLSPARALVWASRRADLLVAGFGREAAWGPVVDALAHHARCPVVFVPSASAHRPISGAGRDGPSPRAPR
ncbi:hypothetical protein GCM10009801_14290 [Streptomyces albiaxialis]|uniref:UspA domain-containing protein n=1 Tax=Streptomyces albiaxialis TaxID=329523 RepID=A0ABN2VN68_9ACTN